MNHYDIIIIGAGPAGLFCAMNCGPLHDASVLILEKNSIPGKKLLLSGSGQCNITHAGTVSDFIHHYGNGGDFVKPVLKTFPPAALRDFLHKNNIPTAERENGKIFPESMRSSDVLSMMVSHCLQNGVTLRYDSPVLKTVFRNGVFTVYSGNEMFTAKILVISTGGKSYPSTGSTGDGFIFAESLGHSIIKPAPSLTPVIIKNFTFAELSGISFKNRNVSLFKNGKKVYSSAGDILFTHKGLSGPVILDMSRYIDKDDILEISLAGKTVESLNSDFISESRLQGRKSIKNFLKNYDFAERLISMILAQERIDPQKNISEISREERVKLFRSLAEYPFIVADKGNYNIAMATAGGVCRDEIDRRTMESKIVPGLYFAGEVTDIDGDTGGYNMQWAFSSGKAAADGIKRKIFH